MSNCKDGYETRVKIHYTIIDGALKPHNVTYFQEKCPADWVPIVSMVFLILIFVLAFILSSLLLVTICTSFTLKKSHVNHLLMNLCLVILIDCFFNLLVSIGYVALRQWVLGYGVCYFNSFTTHMVTSQMGLAVMLLVMDRVFVAHKYGPYMSLSKNSVRLVVTGSWLLSFLLALPLVWGAIFSVPYRKRYACAVSDKIDDYYLIPHIVLIITGVSAMLILGVLRTLWIFHREQRKHRKVKGNQTFSYLDQILMTPYYKNEVYSTGCIALLSIGYFIFWFPFVCVITLTPLSTTHWNNQTRFEESDSKPIDSVQATFILPRSDSHIPTEEEAINIASNQTESTDAVPEMFDTPDYEIAFTWIRYLYHVIIPIIILLSMQDFRSKCMALIFACRPNTVNSSSPKSISPPYLNASLKSQMTKDKKQKNDNMVNFKTPVLFATSEGLHIRTIEDTYQEISDSRPLLSFSKSSSVEPHFNYDLCDVTLGNDEKLEFEGNLKADDYNDFDENPMNIDKSYNNPVVERAHRVAIGQTVPDLEQEDNEASDSSPTRRPPTPPKPKYTEPEIKDNPDEMIPIDIEHVVPRKNGKLVRFNLDLNEEIQSKRNPDNESLLESSTGSKVSNDSGHFGDSEDASPKVQKTHSKSKTKKKSHTTVSKRREAVNLPSNKIRRQKVTVRRLSPENLLHNRQSRNPSHARQLRSKPLVKTIKSRYLNGMDPDE